MMRVQTFLNLAVLAIVIGVAPDRMFAQPVTDTQVKLWRQQMRRALYIPDPLPPTAPQSYGSFTPTPGVVAERVTYQTAYNLRVPAIVYRPAERPRGKMPAVVVVNGHGAVAQYEGSGSVNGVSGYGFRLTVYDAALTGVGSDGIRIKITDSGRAIYDNKAGSSDDNVRGNTQRISGGNIVIHLPS